MNSDFNSFHHLFQASSSTKKNVTFAY